MANSGMGAKAFAGWSAAVVAPIAVAFIAGYFSRASSERGVEGRFVEIAVEILSRTPTEAEAAMRGWAVDILDEYSGVRVSEEARADLVGRVRLFELDEDSFYEHGGTVPPGADVRIVCRLQSNATGPTQVSLSARGVRTPWRQSRNALLAPGDSVELRVTAGSEGLVAVRLNMAGRQARLVFQLFVNDEPIHTIDVGKDAEWTYAVEAPTASPGR